MTSNGAESWEYVDTPVMTGESAGLFSRQFTKPSTSTAVGGDFNIPNRNGVRAIFSEDGGKTWQQAENMPAAYRSCLVAVSDDLLFALGKTGCDYSTDRGKNWTFVDSLNYYTASARKGKNILFLAGSEGRVAKPTIQKR